MQLKPGTDGALALAMAHTIIEEELFDNEFVAHHTYGFEPYRDYVRTFSPEKAEKITGVAAEQIKTSSVHINVMHANVPDEAEKLKNQVLSRFDCAELLISEFTPVMGVHTGPGVVGFAFYSEA